MNKNKTDKPNLETVIKNYEKEYNNAFEKNKIENVKQPQKGKVNCKLLNVRKSPKKDADIIGVISENQEVEIIYDTEDFYKIRTSEIQNGFCMKQFIVKI